MARILAVGIATLDVINEVDGYPGEDDEVRALAHRRARGGNAANLLVALAQQGHECFLASTLPWRDLPGSVEVLDDLHRYQIDIRWCRRVADGTIPTSYICLNRENGSRTIVHYRDFPELGLADFARVELGGLDWVHFEGRNVGETEGMMERVGRRQPSLRCSLEVEKDREGIERLYAHADTIFFSAGFARARGFASAEALLRELHPQLAGRTLICSWGERGATAIGPNGEEAHSPAELPARAVETLGAGDVFNAGVIHGLVSGSSLARALASGCRLSGAKCARRGFDLT